MPSKSKVRGRWQIVVAGEATETQVVLILPHEARAMIEEKFGAVPSSESSPTTHSDQGRPNGTPSQRDTVEDTAESVLVDPLMETVTLQEAVNRGILTGKVNTIGKQILRTHEDQRPRVVGTKGRANVYRVEDLVRWSETVLADK